MTRFLVCLALILSSFSIYAQDGGKTQPTTETPKVANIRKLLTLTGSGKLGVQVIQTMFNNFKAKYTQVDPSFWDEFMKEVKPEDLVNMIVPVYDRNFTAEEIDQLLAFYNSPIGQKLIGKLPVILQESMQIGQAWGEEISKKVLQRLQQKGYLKES